MNNENTYYIKSDRLIPHRAVKVFVKDTKGITRGVYLGYWKPEQGIVRLYPAKESWIYGKLQVHSISDRLVRREA